MRVRMLIAVCVVAGLPGCGSGGDDGGDAAVAKAQELAAAVKDIRSAVGCRTLTAATRRAVVLTGNPGNTCTDGLFDFLTANQGLNKALPTATGFRASVDGDRARITAKGLTVPLTAVRGNGGWRISLVDVPGVRGDLAATLACRRFFAKAAALPPAPSAPGPLAARLRGEARLVDGLRRRLAALPDDGLDRAGLPELIAGLRRERDELRARARTGGGSDSALRRVRRLVAAAPAARVRCPAP